MEKYLELKWTVSRGKDTYGYNICTLWDGDKPYRCCGGGYDMVGTVMGIWLEKHYLEKLQTLIPHGEPGGEKNYGLNRSRADGHLYLDGACGLDCMVRLAKLMGVSVKFVYGGKQRHLKGFIVKEEP